MLSTIHTVAFRAARSLILKACIDEFGHFDRRCPIDQIYSYYKINKPVNVPRGSYATHPIIIRYFISEQKQNCDYCATHYLIYKSKSARNKEFT